MQKPSQNLAEICQRIKSAETGGYNPGRNLDRYYTSLRVKLTFVLREGENKYYYIPLCLKIVVTLKTSMA